MVKRAAVKSASAKRAKTRRNVLVPINDLAAFDLLVDAGATELYAGFQDVRWSEAFDGAELNRMSGFGTEANALTLDDTLELAARCTARRVGLYITFNSSSYTDAQLDYMEEFCFHPLAGAGIAGVIASSLALIERAHAAGLGCAASTLCNIVNVDIARAFVEAGATRLVLPREVSIPEMSAITAVLPDAEYEVFAMRNGCTFSDALCLGKHCQGKPSLCRSLREGARWECPTGASDTQLTESLATHATWADGFHLRTCGLCAVRALDAAGADSFKIVGRGDDPRDIAESVRLVSSALALIDSCPDDASFAAAIERPRPIEEFCALQGLSCYYEPSTY